MPTLGDIIEGAQDLIGEVAGSGVQTYAEDRQLRDAVRGFNMMFKKYHWDQYSKWLRLALDGTLGIVEANADLASVLDYEDFFAVHRDAEPRPLSVLPPTVNPYVLTGTTVLYWTSLHASHANFATRKLQFYPVASTGYVNIRARVYPISSSNNWEPDSVVHLDEDLLTYATAFMSLAVEDLNPQATEVVKNLMEMKYKDIIASLASRPMTAYAQAQYPTQWSV